MEKPVHSQTGTPEHPEVTYRLGPPPAASASKLAWGLALSCVPALILAGTWASYVADHRQDQYQLIQLGQRVRDGGRMYADTWENKPPGIAWINAAMLALGREHRLFVWLGPAALALASLAVMGWSMARVLSGRVACVSVFLGAVLVSLRLYDTPSINPDCYAASFETMGLSLFIAALVATRPRSVMFLTLAAGLTFALGATVKQSACLGPVVILFVAIVSKFIRFDGRKRFVLSTILVWVGFLLGCSAVVGVLYQRGTLADAWAAVFTFNRGLLSFDGWARTVSSFSRAWASLSPLQLPLWLAMAGVIVTLATGCAGSIKRAVAGTLSLWIVGAIILALVGPSRSLRYFQAVFPPMLWLAGLGLFHIGDAYGRLERGIRSMVVVLALTVLLLMGRPLAETYLHGLAESHVASQRPLTERSAYKTVGGKLREWVPEGKSIYVLAYDSGVYVHARRPSASRFTYPRSQEQMAEILGDLEADRAHAILVPAKRASQFDRWCAESCRERIARVTNRYRSRGNVGVYEVYLQPRAEPATGE